MKRAPKPNKDFDSYILVISPTHGLVKIIAIGVIVKTGDTGSELREAFNAVVAGVSQKYGAPSQEFDFCNGGVGCSSSSAWMLSLLEKNRTLMTAWEHPTNASHLVAIAVQANPLSLNEGFVDIQYQFEGFTEWVNAENAKQNDTY